MVELAVFDNVFDVRFNLLKSLLDEAGIPYVTSNETYRSIKPLISQSPGNVAIGLKVRKEDLEEAQKILKSIE